MEEESNLRSGQWTTEEITFSTRLIDEFRNGSLDLPEGTSMRGFLAEKLGCVAKRVSKRYENTNYNGRLQYVRDKTLSAEVCVRTRLEMEELERKFRKSIRREKAMAKKEGTTAVKKRMKGRRRKRQQQMPAPKATETKEGAPAKDTKTQYQEAQSQPQQQEQSTSELKAPPQELPAPSEAVNSVEGGHSMAQEAPALVHLQIPAHATGGAALLAGLEQTLKRNATANEELASLLATRQRLAEQSLSFQRANIEGNSALARANQMILSSLSSLQHQPQLSQQQPASLMAQQPSLMASHGAQAAANNIEQLRFLGQVEMERQQRLLASTTVTVVATASRSSLATLNIPTLTRPEQSGFEHQARLIVLARASNSKREAQQQQLIAGIPKDLWDKHIASKNVNNNNNGNTSNNVQLKRKEGPPGILPDPKRTRYL